MTFGFIGNDGAAKREGPMIGGISAELAALIQKIHLGFQGPVVHIAAPPIPLPHSPPLADALIPTLIRSSTTVMHLAEGGRRS